MEQQRTSSFGSPSSEGWMLAPHPQVTGSRDMQTFSRNLPQLNQENNNRSLFQPSYFRGDNVNFHQFNSPSMQQQGRTSNYPTLPAYAPISAESFTQNVVDQLVQPDHRGNLINQRQLDGHTGNLSQASQGIFPMSYINGLLPSYPTEGAFNPIWNSNNQQADSFTQNVVDQPVHPDHVGNLINQHQLDGSAGNFFQASQAIVSVPHITGLLPSYAAEGALNPTSNSNTQQAISTEATILHDLQASSNNNRGKSFTQNVVGQPFHSDHGGNLINQRQLDGRAGIFSQTSNGNVSVPHITGMLPSYAAEGSFNPLWNFNTQESDDDLPEWDPFVSSPQQVSVNPPPQGNQNQNFNVFYPQNPFRGPITNAVYDPMYAILGKPVDPHLRLFMELIEQGTNGGL